MSVIKKQFGTTADNRPVMLYTITNKRQTSVSTANFGGAIQSLSVPDKTGKFVDVALGYDDVGEYEKQDTYVGCLIGRCANRIARGRFTLNGQEYRLHCNNGGNHLHGGKTGFDKRIWQCETTSDCELHLTYRSRDGEEGYPGELDVRVTYRLTDCNSLVIDYRALAKQDTVCSLTNHSYFNLSGFDSGDVGDHIVRLYADAYAAADADMIPSGEILPVEGTPLDFRRARQIKDGLDAEFGAIQAAGGYDHNFVIPEYDGSLKRFAEVYAPKTGIAMYASTTLPGFQFYSGNFLNGKLPGKKSAPILKRGGFCLESQYFPNAINVPSFIRPILRAGNEYEATTEFQFDLA